MKPHSAFLLPLVLMFILIATADIIKAKADTIQLSGRIVDNHGNPVSGVQIRTIDVGYYTSTDSDGYYSLATPSNPSGFTELEMVNDPYYVNPGVVSSMPNSWTMTVPLNLTTDTTLDIEIPTNTIQIKVKYPDGSYVPDAFVQLYLPNGASIPIDTSLGGFSAGVTNSQNRSNATFFGFTDPNGNLTAVVLSGTTYRIGIDSPNGNYLQILTDESITSDMTKTYVFNSPPTINGLNNATLYVGDTYSANGFFKSTNATSQAATVDYGDGTGEQQLTLSYANFNEGTFALNHRYDSAGIRTISVRVTDVGGETGTATATVEVATVSHVGPPTTINQCKKGGWQAFDTPRRFKNQGDCIQFVNTGK